MIGCLKITIWSFHECCLADLTVTSVVKIIISRYSRTFYSSSKLGMLLNIPAPIGYLTLKLLASLSESAPNNPPEASPSVQTLQSLDMAFLFFPRLLLGSTEMLKPVQQAGEQLILHLAKTCDEFLR